MSEAIPTITELTYSQTTTAREKPLTVSFFRAFFVEIRDSIV